MEILDFVASYDRPQLIEIALNRMTKIAAIIVCIIL